MPNTILKDNLQRLVSPLRVMRALTEFTCGPVNAATRAYGRRSAECFASTRAALSATFCSAVGATTSPSTRMLASRLLHLPGHHVSMNRRALLVCLALGAWAQAGAQSVGRETPEVQTLIEALRPLPATRGVERPSAAASAALTIEFEGGSVRLTEQGRRSLDTLGTALASEDLEPYEFRIEVYVESGATASRDQLLSKRQANAIKDYLVKQYQLSPRRLATDGRGSAQPIKRTNPASPVNRRVMVVNTSTIQ
jgi:outer membrane protein OmpA-like peptidoglycan-associated protein